MRNYGNTAIKWQKTYFHDAGDPKYDIGYDMNVKLKAIMKEKNLNRSKLKNSSEFNKQIQRNTFGSCSWNPLSSTKDSDDIIKLICW